MAHFHFAVLARDHKVIEAYLYSHTEVVGVEVPAPLHQGTMIIHLQTSAETPDRAQYLAEYQANRLWSGLYPATSPTSTSQAGLTVWSQPQPASTA